MRLLSPLQRFRPPRRADLLLGFCGALTIGLYAWSRDHWWAPMPWGLANIWWELPELPEFRSLSVSVEIERELPPEARLYIAPIGLAWLNDTPFYAGLQAGAHLPDGEHGRIAIFSRWHERRPDYIHVAPGGYCESAGYEGDFVSVRQPIPWRRGRYTQSFSVVGRDPEGRGIWIGHSVRHEDTGAVWIAGGLCFPGERLHLRRHIAAFVEIFGPRMRPRAIPATSVRFGDLRVNGMRVPLRRPTARYKPTIPPFARVTPDGDGGVIVETGRRFRRAGLARERGSYTERIGW